MSSILIAILTCLALKFLWSWWFARRPKAIPKHVEEIATGVMAYTGGVDLDDEDDCLTPIKPGFKLTKFRARLVLLAKAKFGLLKRSQANYLMVRKHLLGIMEEHKVRPAHIATQLDIVVSLFFIPSDSDIIAHQIGATAEAHNRDGMMTDVWESFYGIFGRMKGFASA
jgi:hypothetical protein